MEKVKTATWEKSERKMQKGLLHGGVVACTACETEQSISAVLAGWTASIHWLERMGVRLH